MSGGPLTVFTVIRNGIQNGYPFVEAYGSWLDYCDRLFVLDGESNDGTDIILSQLASLSDKVELASAPWPTSSAGGSSIATFTNQAFERIRGDGGRVLYIQADELLGKTARRRVANFDEAAALQFTRYVLFWNSFYQVIVIGQPCAPGTTHWCATRLFPADAQAVSTGDGLSFEVENLAVVPFDEPILHYGWCFPVNILQKHVSHVNLYPDVRRYRKRAHLAGDMLRRHDYDVALLEALDPEYRDLKAPFAGEHPECMQHLLASTYYDPSVGIGLLADGVQW